MTAIFDPLPIVDQLKSTHSYIAKPNGDPRSTTCADFHTKIDRSVICFRGDGVLAYAFTRGYSADFKDCKSFESKHIARQLVSNPESGTTVKAFITELRKLTVVDESMFSVDRSTPLEQRINRAQVDEDTIRQLATDAPITWAAVGGGLLKGRCAVYISVDRTGQPREVWPAGCDNPGLQDPLGEQVRKWKFKSAFMNGTPAQFDGLLTFEYQTKLVEPAQSK